MGRILNKMCIIAGGVTGEDKLSSYRFLTKKMLDTTPQWGYVCPLFDEWLARGNARLLTRRQEQFAEIFNMYEGIADAIC